MISRNYLRIAIGVCLSLMVFACSKSPKTEDSPPPDEEVPGTPVITPRGATTGAAVTANIGPGGGQLTSADNAIKLVVPAGALTANQTFSIQPVENMLRPDMEGRAAYRLLPENLEFAKPITVTMKYNPADITPGSEDVLSIAYQSSNGKWMGTNASLDKATKTLTVETKHFSDYTFYELYDIFTNRTKELGGGEVADLRVGVHAMHPRNQELYSILTKIPPTHSRDNEISYCEAFQPYVTEVVGWKIITGGGQIQPRDNFALLKANAKYFSPEVIDNINTATVEVSIKGLKPIPDYRAPRGGRELGQLIMRKSFTLVPDVFMELEGNGKSVLMRENVGAFVGNGMSAITGFDPISSLGISINFGATTVGGFDCGEAEPNSGKAFVTFHYKGANGTEELAASGYCQSNGNTQETKFSSGKVIIKRFDADIIEGEFSGPLYAQVPNGLCEYETKTVSCRFRIRRQ